jgi:DNA (cytosine-5)-methyltransferase 1
MAGVESTVAFEPGACARLGGHVWHNEPVGALRADMGDNQTAVVYDARGNGNGQIVNTLTGDHENRVTDYTAICVTPEKEEQQPIAYGICSQSSNSMKSANPVSGFYEATTSRTLDTNAVRPDCNQGGIAVVAVQGSMIGRKPENGPRGSGVSENISFCLTEADRHSVAYTMTTGAFPDIQKEQASTLMARDYKSPQIVGRPQYVIRRLTPTEAALLQGFPPDWCSGLETPEPTEEDIAFWAKVWETHRNTVGTAKKPKSRNQIIKWLQNPHSDSAEYKMWGNGVSLSIVVFVLSGIALYAQE